MASPTAEHSVAIDAPIDVVWSVMTDLPRYGEWNPFVVSITRRDSAPMRVGTAVSLHVRWSDGGEERTVEVVTRLEPPGRGSSSDARRATMEYRYTGWLPRLHLVEGSRLQTLEQAPGGRTVYRTLEVFRGLLAFAVPLAKVQDGFERHAAALAARAQALAAAASP
jgi:uncharacterized protein YndB with AHSA1/START domain